MRPIKKLQILPKLICSCVRKSQAISKRFDQLGLEQKIQLPSCNNYFSCVYSVVACNWTVPRKARLPAQSPELDQSEQGSRVLPWWVYKGIRGKQPPPLWHQPRSSTGRYPQKIPYLKGGDRLLISRGWQTRPKYDTPRKECVGCTLTESEILDGVVLVSLTSE